MAVMFASEKLTLGRAASKFSATASAASIRNAGQTLHRDVTAPGRNSAVSGNVRGSSYFIQEEERVGVGAGEGAGIDEKKDDDDNDPGDDDSDDVR